MKRLRNTGKEMEKTGIKRRKYIEEEYNVSKGSERKIQKEIGMAERR